MVVHDLHIFASIGCPDKAETELIVNANAVLSRAVAAKSFEPITGWHAQILQFSRAIKHSQLPHCCSLNTDKTPNAVAVK
jgi:hypothetical protein